VFETLNDAAVEYLTSAGTSFIQCLAATQHYSEIFDETRTSTPDLKGLTLSFLFSSQSSITVFEELLRSIYNTMSRWIRETAPEITNEEFKSEIEDLLNQFTIVLRPVGKMPLAIIEEAYHVAITHLLPERILTYPVKIDYEDPIGKRCMFYFT
jgi:hypothetical protein